MTPKFRNTTALALCLGLMPLAAMAEDRLPQAEAVETQKSRIAQMPGLADLLDAEIEMGLVADDLVCLNGAERPCKDGAMLLTPAGLSVQISEDGMIVLGAPNTQTLAVAANGGVQPRPDAPDALRERVQKTLAALKDAPGGMAKLNAAHRARQMLEAERRGAAAPAPEKTTAEVLRENGSLSEVGAAAKAAAAAKPDTSAQDKAAQEEQARKLAESLKSGDSLSEIGKKATQPAKPAAPAEAPNADALAKALADAEADAVSETKSATAPSKLASDRFGKTEARLKPAIADELHTRRAAQMPGLDRVLAEEIAAGLTLDQLECLSGQPRPCPDTTVLKTPKGIAVQVSTEGRIILAAPNRQQVRADGEGNLAARGAASAAAKTAAEAKAPEAAALNATSEAAQVSAETVSADATRSSSEDFTTSLTKALEEARAQGRAEAQANTRSDSGSDLAKVALAGLGALAVGQFLSGDREVALNTGDRVVVTNADGSQQVLKDENALLRQPGAQVETQAFADGSSRSVVKRADGSQVVTIRAADLSVLRRVHVAADGTETVLIDESAQVAPVDVASLPAAPTALPVARGLDDEAALREALAREAVIDRRFTLSQIRNIPEVRNLVAPVDIDAITFDSGSAAIKPDQARELASLGRALQDAIRENPREIFLIEGHTDAVGTDSYNLALSDRRAESVALALSEYFAVPPENMVVQGYGEEYLKVVTPAAERANRRASVRRITDLLASAAR